MGKTKNKRGKRCIASRNGTFIALSGSLRLNEGDEVWMGEQRFRFVELRSAMPAADGKFVAVKSDPPPPAMAAQTGMQTPASTPADASPAEAAAEAAAAPEADAPAAPEADAPAGEPLIIQDDGTEIPAVGDEELPMVSYMADAGFATDESSCIDGSCGTLWECWDQEEPDDSGGSCGKCVVTVLEGMNNLSEASSREKNTIKKANKKLGGKLDEPNCRLACQAIAHGPVKIRPKGK